MMIRLNRYQFGLKRILPIILLGAFLLVSVNVRSQGFLRTDGTNFVNDTGKVALRGINLGGWLQTEGYIMDVWATVKDGQPEHYFWKDWSKSVYNLLDGDQTRYDEVRELFLDNFIVERDLEIISESGFNHVRLPFHYNMFWDEETNTESDEGFEYVDKCLDWCKNNDLYLVLDLHVAPKGQSQQHHADVHGGSPTGAGRFFTSDFENDKQICYNIWRRLADRYKDEPNILGYDLLNEPVGDNTPNCYDTEEVKADFKLRQYYVECTEVIREVDTNHVIIAEGNFFGADYCVLLPAWDDNMAFGIHNYWTSPSPHWYGETEQVETSIEINVPIWLGEFGENSNNWNHYMRDLAEKENVGWCAWTYKKVMSISCAVSPGWTMQFDECYQNPLCNNGNWNGGFWLLTEYWNGVRNQNIHPDSAYNWLTDWCRRMNTETGDLVHINHDFIDALVRDDFDVKGVPYPYPGGNAIPNSVNDSLVVRAYHYDMGDHDVAHWDGGPIRKDNSPDGGEPWNDKWRNRNDGVDIMIDWDGGNHRNLDTAVFLINGGDWMDFTFDFPVKGEYSIAFRNRDGGSVTLEENGTTIAGGLTIPSTPSWTEPSPIDPNVPWFYFYDWNKIPGTFQMEGGEHTLRFKFSGGNLKFSHICIKLEQEIGPAIEFEANKEKLCMGEEVVYSNISTNLTGSETYDWDFGEGASPAVASVPGPHAVSYSTPGWKDVTLSVNGGLCVRFEPEFVIVDSIPMTLDEEIVGDTVVCEGDSMIAYTVPRIDNVEWYEWTVPSGLELATGNGTRSIRANVATSSALLGPVIMTPMYRCGAGPDIISDPIRVRGLPGDAGPITGDLVVCPNQNYEYSIDPVVDATTYNWDHLQVMMSMSGEGTTDLTLRVNSTDSYLTVTPENLCGTGASSTINIQVVPPWMPPNFTVTAPANACEGDTIEVSVPSNVVSDDFDWTIPVGSTIYGNADLGTIQVIMGSTGGEFSVVSNGACGVAGGSGTSGTITVSPLPQAPTGLVVSASPWCPGETYNAEVTSVGGLSYGWTLPDGSTISSGAGTAVIEILAGSNEGAIEVRSQNSCGFSDPLTTAMTLMSGVTGPDTVCSMERGVQFSIPGTGASGFNWTVPTGATIASGQGTETITVDFGTTSGDVEVSLTGSSCAGPFTKAVFLEGGGSIPTVISGDTVFCSGAGGTFEIANDGSLSNISWSVPTGSSIVGASDGDEIQVDQVVSDGQIEVSFEGGCGVVSSLSLNVYAGDLPDQPTIDGEVLVCGSSSTPYTIVSPVSGVDYTWAVSGGGSVTSGQGTDEVQLTFASASSTITVTPENDCGAGPSAQLEVNQGGAAPVDAISGAANICTSSSEEAYSLSGAVTYNSISWTVPSGWSINGADDGVTVQAVPGVTTGYVRVSAETDCATFIDSLEVVVTSEIDPGSISGSSSVCPSSSGVAYNITSNSAISSYTWSVVGDATTAVGGSANEVLVDFQSTDVQVVVDLTGDCLASTQVTLDVTVSNQITIDTILGPTTICGVEDPVSYSISNGASFSSLTWTYPSDWTLVSEDPSGTIELQPSTTSGTVSVEGVGSCGTATQSVDVVVDQDLTSYAITGNGSYCEDQASGISFTTQPGASAYTWTLPAGSTLNSGADSEMINVDLEVPGGYVVLEVEGRCGEMSTDSMFVEVQSVVDPGSIVGPGWLCPNSSGIIYEVLSDPGITSYQWTVSGASISGSTSGNQVAVDFGTSDAVVSLELTGACLTTTELSTDVTITTTVEIGELTGPDAVCSTDGQQTYSVAENPSILSYNWVVPSGVNLISANGASEMILEFTAGNATVTVEGVGACGTVIPGALDVNVREVSTAVSITGENELCENTTGTYSIPDAGGSYQWTVSPEQSGFIGENTNEVAVTIDSDFELEVTDNACLSPIQLSVMSVTMLEAPETPVISGLSTVCPNELAVGYGIDSEFDAETILWTVSSDATFSSDVAVPEVEVDFGESASVVSVTVSNSCGTEQATLDVSIVSDPEDFEIEGETLVCITEEDVPYEATITDMSLPVTWTISTGGGIFTSIDDNFAWVNFTDSLVTIEAVVVNGCDRSASSSIEVMVLGEDHVDCMTADLNIPTSFTPNGDGMNDDWGFTGVEASEVSSLFVYNRWGNKVFESNNGYDDRFDGRLNGKPLPVGTYYYVLNLDGLYAGSYFGSVTIVR